MAISSQGTTLSFSGFSALITSISIEEGQGEVVDMTKVNDPVGYKRMVATGALVSPAKVSVEYIRSASTPPPLTIVGMSGTLSITHSRLTLSKPAIVDTASHELAVDSAVRGRVTFIINQSQ